MFSYYVSLSCCPSLIISAIYLQQTITDTHTHACLTVVIACLCVCVSVCMFVRLCRKHRGNSSQDFLRFCAAIIHRVVGQECGNHPDAGGSAICSTIHEQIHRAIHPAGKHSSVCNVLQGEQCKESEVNHILLPHDSKDLFTTSTLTNHTLQFCRLPL